MIYHSQTEKRTKNCENSSSFYVIEYTININPSYMILYTLRKYFLMYLKISKRYLIFIILICNIPAVFECVRK